MRSGTENVAAIAGFGVAARSARHHLLNAGQMCVLRTRLEDGLRAINADVRVFGCDTERLPNTTLFAVRGIASELAVIACDLEGAAISAGAACSSGKVARNPVVEAMGAADLARSALRVSFTPATRAGDIDDFLGIWDAIQGRLLGRPRRMTVG